MINLLFKSLVGLFFASPLKGVWIFFNLPYTYQIRTALRNHSV